MSHFIELDRKIEVVKLHNSLKNVSPRGGSAIVEVRCKPNFTYVQFYLSPLRRRLTAAQ
jgi:hypothetical protein